METNHNNQSTIDLETLIRSLKTEDTRNLKLMHNMQSFMWGIAIVYVFIFALKFIMTTPWYEKLGGFLIMLAFVAFAIFFRDYYKEYKSIDYGIPTIDMLNKAACRHGLFHRRSLFIIVPLTIESIGLNLMMYDSFNNPDPLFRILIFQMSFLFTLAIAFLIGYFIWKKRQKPLRDYALKLLKEIQS